LFTLISGESQPERPDPVTGLPTFARARLGMGLSQQIVKPFTNMSARDNVAFAAGLHHTRSVWRSLTRVSRSRERRNQTTAVPQWISQSPAALAAFISNNLLLPLAASAYLEGDLLTASYDELSPEMQGWLVDPDLGRG